LFCYLVGETVHEEAAGVRPDELCIAASLIYGVFAAWGKDDDLKLSGVHPFDSSGQTVRHADEMTEAVCDAFQCYLRKKIKADINIPDAFQECSYRPDSV
jgi:hypothetical protein